MRRAGIAVLVVIACLAAAGPAAAQVPTVTVSPVECTSDNQAHFSVAATGLNPGESHGILVVDSDNVGQTGATATTITRADGSFEAILTAQLDPGTYTVYAYTGPYQNLADASHWEGSIHVETFEPSLATSWTSTTIVVPCGPPTKGECKASGWLAEGYTNQGRCVSASAPGRQ
jgi:hypothetical protein